MLSLSVHNVIWSLGVMATVLDVQRLRADDEACHRSTVMDRSCYKPFEVSRSLTVRIGPDGGGGGST